MRNDWILDVLADLKAFAQNNELTLLAEQLETTRRTALAEIASSNEGAPHAVQRDDTRGGADTRGVGTGYSA